MACPGVAADSLRMTKTTTIAISLWHNRDIPERYIRFYECTFFCYDNKNNKRRVGVVVYDLQWINNFSGFTKETPMNLKGFCKFFDEHIANRNYIYQTDNKQFSQIIIRAELSQLPHLMGLQHFLNLPYKQAEKLIQSMLNEEITVDFLKKADKDSWDEFRDRIEGTPLIYKMLNSYPSVKLVCKKMIAGEKSSYARRNMDLIFIDELGKYQYVLELREIEKESNVYALTSLSFGKKNKNKNLTKFPHTALNIQNLSIQRIIDKDTCEPKHSDIAKQKKNDFTRK